MTCPTPEQDRETVLDALLDSQYIAGAQAGWNAANSSNPEEAFALLMASRTGHLRDYRAAKDRLRAGVQC